MPVHRPGRERERLTPANASALLFDDVIWADLTREGVEVLHLTDLPSGALEAPRGPWRKPCRFPARSSRGRDGPG